MAGHLGEEKHPRGSPFDEQPVCPHNDRARIADLIERGNFSGVKEAMEKSMAEGSQTFEEALAQLVRSGRIDRAEALAFADSPTNLMWRLENDVVKASHAAPSSQFAELATPGEDDMPSFTEIMLEVKPN